MGSPQTAGEGSAGVEVEELGGVALEGVTIRHGSPHGVLEFLVAAGNAGASLQLVGPQRRRQEVGQVVIPHGCHLQVLEESDRVQGAGPFADLALRSALGLSYLPVFRHQEAHLQLQLVADGGWIQRGGAERGHRGQRAGGPGGTHRLQSLLAHCFPPRWILRGRKEGNRPLRVCCLALSQHDRGYSWWWWRLF